MRNQTCGNCCASEPFRDPNNLSDTKLVCRRHPPQASAVAVSTGNARGGIMNVTNWPLVIPEGWCMEWTARLEHPPGEGG